MVEKLGYLRYTVTGIEITERKEIELEEHAIIAGDVAEDGEIELDDLVDLNDNFGALINHEEGESDLNRIYDLNEDGIVDKLDRDIIKKNYKKQEEIIEWVKPEEITEKKLRIMKEDFILPMESEYKITSSYGLRVDPITGEEKKHKGIDIKGEHHTEILAVSKGEVTYSGVMGSYGNCIEVKHIVKGETIYSFYAHLSERKVKEGDEVEQGEVIAIEGGDQKIDPNPGSTTGHHLHFEMRKASGSGNDVDPSRYINF